MMIRACYRRHSSCECIFCQRKFMQRNIGIRIKSGADVDVRFTLCRRIAYHGISMKFIVGKCNEWIGAKI